MAVVARMLRGEPLELVARETNVSIARLSEWREPSFARCYGLARFARVRKISRASVYRSLKETTPTTAEAVQLAGLASGLNRIATRAMCGAISLSSSSNFAPKLGSKT